MTEDAEDEKLFDIPDFDVKLTAEKKAVFLQNFANCCNVTRAAKLSGITRQCVYLWRDNDDQFAIDFEKAREIGFEAMEDEMHRRAFEGTLRVTQSGAYREYSDTLAIFLSKAHNPEKYNERVRNEISGPGGQPLQLDDARISAKLNSILNNALLRKNSVEQKTSTAQDDDDDFSDLA